MIKPSSAAVKFIFHIISYNMLMEPYYINYGELNIVKNKFDKIIPKIKKKMIQL